VLDARESRYRSDADTRERLDAELKILIAKGRLPHGMVRGAKRNGETTKPHPQFHATAGCA